MTGKWRQPSIEQARQVQVENDLATRHVVWLGPRGFVIAHTDDERTRGSVHRCELHTYLSLREEQPHPTGWYIVQRIAGTWRFDHLGPHLSAR